MKRAAFPALVLLLVPIFFLWSPFGGSGDPEPYAESAGELLLPQRNTAIVTLDMNQAGLVFTEADHIRRLQLLQKDFVEIPGAARVESILNASRVISVNDEIIVAGVIPENESLLTNAYLENIAAEIPRFPELSPYISENRNILLFYISFSNRTSSRSILDELSRLQEKRRDTIPFEFTGRSPAIAATESLLTKDIGFFFPVLAVMVIVIFSFLRNLKAVAASVLLIVIAILFGYGLVRFIGIPDTPLILLIPVFGLGLLSDYLIHYFYHRLHAPAPAGGLSVRSFLLFPLSLTALSTLIGFLSLSLIKGSGHLQLGLIIAAGVAAVWFGVFYWLDFTRYKRPSKHVLSALVESQGRMFRGIAGARYVIFALIAAASAWGAAQLGNLSIEPYPIEQLPGDTTIKKAERIINDEFFGTVPFFIEVDTGKANGLLEKDALLEMNRIHGRFEEEGTGYAYSMLTVLKRIHFYFRGSEEALLTSSEFDDIYDALIAQYLLYYSGSVDPLEYESLLDASYRLFSIRGLIHYANSDDLSRFMNLLEDIQKEFPENWSLSVHGTVSRLEDERRNLRSNWVLSFLGGSLLIFVTVLIFYRKLSLALLSLVPGAVSMLISFGIISAAGIRIDVFSIIFAAVITGLVIDYSIHTLAAVDQLKTVRSLDKGFSAVVGCSGIPITLSFLTSLFSFSVLLLSSFRGARSLGFLLLISLILSFFFSLYLIPLIILPIRQSREKYNNASDY